MIKTNSKKNECPPLPKQEDEKIRHEKSPNLDD